jgi:hypothetical protein
VLKNLGMKMTHLQRAYIFDIDGVLADCSHRLHFIQQEPKDWKRFYENSDKDEVIQPNKNTLRLLRNALHGYQTRGILFVTGRSEAYRELTMNWLKKKVWGCFGNFYNDMLFMRKDGDFRPDWEVKKEIYEKELKDKYEILGVFEDRTQVVQMWRSLGLTCYQVCEGNY